MINASLKVQHAAGSETLLAVEVTIAHDKHSFSATASSRTLAGWLAGWQELSPHIFQALNTCANYELSRIPERREFPRICISLFVCASARKRKKEREHKTFPLVYGRSEVFACNFFAVASRSRIFFHTLFATLNGQRRLWHLNAHYRPQNRARDMAEAVKATRVLKRVHVI